MRRALVFRRAWWMPAMAVVTTIAMLMASAATALAEPLRPTVAAPPQPNKGPAVRNVTPLRPHFTKVDDPARRTFTAKPTVWPPTGTSSIALDGPSAARTPGAKSQSSATPVWAQASTDPGHAYDGPASVEVRMLDHATAEGAGVTGALFTVSAAAVRSGHVRIGLNFREFSQAYGGNYAARLKLVQLPECVLTAPGDPACRRPVELGSTVDFGAGSVSAVVPFPGLHGTNRSAEALSAPSVAVLAVTSDPGGGGSAGGTYAATDLKASGTWSGGTNTGSFTYTYPLGLPSAPSPLAPNLELSYDSGSVDGQTAATQAQASWLGEGWSTPRSYIEQSFISCSDDPEGSASPSKTQDMCYDGPILTMSLNGSSTALIWDSSKSVWKPQQDDGSVIARVTGSNNGSGTYNTDYWTVTARDGSVYMFGRNHLPGWSSGKPATNSVDNEPVFSAHANDPCYNPAGFSSSVCTMAYRWNLDYVKDVHGNAMAYYYKQDRNYYGQNNGASMVSYVRDSYLDHIDYGFTDGNAFGTVPDKVMFKTGDRCLSGTCQPLNAANKANWPDVPFDLVCASGATCGAWSPSYFSTVRLTSIETQQYSTASSQYATVDSYALSQTIPPAGDGTSATLWLASITRTAMDLTGGGSAAITQPPVAFAGIQLANRADTTNLPAFYKYRIARITTESGSEVTPTYERINPCSVPVTLDPATNTTSCYPISWTPPAYTAPIVDWFNKYMVTKVVSTDPTGLAPALSTTYQYLGGAAWHYDDNEVVKSKYRTYGQFRGYGDVKVLNGDGTHDRQTLNETKYYRGMSKNNNSTVVNVTDSEGGVSEDVDELAGREREAISYLGNGGPVDHVTITSYWVSGSAATRSRTGLSALNSTRVAPAEVLTKQAVTGTGPTTWRYNETDNTYDASLTSPTYGLLLRTYTHTVPAAPPYDRCTSTTYAPANTTANLVGLPSEVETDAVACGGFVQGTPASRPGSYNTLTAPTSVNRPAQVMSATRTFYDDTTWSPAFPQPAAPTKGDVTMVQNATDYASGTFTYQTKTRSAYDAYGRVVDNYDGRGSLTSTAYTQNSVGLVVGMRITNALDQNTSSTMAPARALTLTTTDLNGVVTTQQYDALGRLTSVWFNSRPTSSPANKKFSYQESNTDYSWSKTEVLNDENGYLSATVIYDALLRVRQTHTATPQSGRMVTDTFYDSRGWVSSKTNGWWHPGALPGTVPVKPSDVSPPPDLPNQNVYTYDGLGRVVQDHRQQNNQDVSVVTTVYNGDRMTIVPPAGAVVATTVTDPIGRTSELDQYTALPTVNVPADTFTGTFSIAGGTTVATTYGFDARGIQNSVREASGAVWTSNYDLAGHLTSKSDPDTGTTTGMQYDANGNMVQSTDARGRTVSYTYDVLNRKTARYASDLASQVPGSLTASWVYDNSDNAIPNMTYALGHLTSSTAYWNGSAYKQQTRNFNIFGQSTGVTATIPPAEGALAGTYTVLHQYSTTTGLLLRDVYPAFGGLPAETVNHQYAGALDLPTILNGLSDYSHDVTYDAYGRVAQTVLGTSLNYASITNTWDAHTGRVTEQLVTRSVASPTDVYKQSYRYDLSGNLTRQTDTRLGSPTPTETQCYRYDALDQLTEAWTATDACAAGPSTGIGGTVGDPLGAQSAYWTSWNADLLGWRSQTQHSVAGGTDTTVNYGYGGIGATQPHTLTSTTTTGASAGSTSYGYDASGNMISRNAGNGNQTLAWNNDGQLVSVSGSTGGNSSFVYDPDGALLLEKDPNETVLYLDDQQFTLNRASNVVSGTRYYTLPGGAQAVRTGTAANAFVFQLTDQHGTPTLYLDSTAQTPTWRQYTPYGAPRGPAVTAVDNRGFLDKPINSNTGLTVVGARSYDPAVGRFISSDPVLDTSDPQQLNGYGYGANNPNSHADPSGQRYDGDGGGNAEANRQWALLEEAKRQRDELARTKKGGGKTFTGAYNVRTGQVYPAISGDGSCAEGNACRKLGIPMNDPDVRFTKAVTWTYNPKFRAEVFDSADVPQNDANGNRIHRTKYLVEKPICLKCQNGSELWQYEKGTKWVNGGRWSQLDKAGMLLKEPPDAIKGPGALTKAAPFVRGAFEWGGRALFVASAAIDIYDVVTAPPGQKAERAAEAVGGMAGAWAMAAIGAEIGLAVAPALGPFAPVAPVVGALIGGFIGSKAGRGIAHDVAKIFHW